MSGKAGMIRAALFAPLLLLAACTPAHAATRSYMLTDFAKLRLAGPYDVRVHVGGNARATASGDMRALDRLSVRVEGDTLVIKPDPNGAWGGWNGATGGRVVVNVTAPALSAAGLDGSGDIAIDRVQGDDLALAIGGSGDLSVGAMAVTRLVASSRGSGTMTLAGHAKEAQFAMNGAGDTRAGDLSVEDATVSVTGSGDFKLAAQHAATLNVAGSGDVTIDGPAACTVARSGSGDVTCAHKSVAGEDQ